MLLKHLLGRGLRHTHSRSVLTAQLTSVAQIILLGVSSPPGACIRRIEILYRRVILHPGSGGQSLSLPTQEPSPTLPPSVRQLFDGHEVATMRRRSPQTRDRRAHNGWKGHKLLRGGRPSNGCEDFLLPDLFHLPVGNPILFKVAAALSYGFSQVSRLFIILIIKLE